MGTTRRDTTTTPMEKGTATDDAWGWARLGFGLSQGAVNRLYRRAGVGPRRFEAAVKSWIKSKVSFRTLLLVSACVLGIGARLLLVLLAGARPTGPTSGGGDAYAYIALGESLLAGKGLAYAGHPTAIRAPLYPMILAATHWLFGSGYLFVVRLLQLLAGCITAWLASRAARQIWANGGGETTLAISLLLPTFIFFTAEILTESFGIL